ncbi:MAG: lamin tail domain-containing protein [Candidatus Pacebacteria bacterium]|nr:lamin tail domain-containing protein [Candidatus Paceibacterota bacterium]PIR60496.1 MAG: hypothetical protein COU67_01850 [Candidatus Pacebacteria bacterium CG10_big_fil_rev_8_21_14_0_10_44_54]
MRITLCTLLIAFTLRFGLDTAHAQNIVVSELYPAPNAGENEWIELYNAASSAADLTDWTVFDTLSTPSLLHQFTDFILQPYEIFILNLSGSTLNNTGDTVVLSDPAATYSASLSYSSSTKGLSWHQDLLTGEVFESSPSAGIVATASAVQPSPIPIATQAAVSATPAAVVIKPNVQLSEIMACPYSGQPEWIELRNFGETISLENWLITDSTGNTRELAGLIANDSRVVFSWSNSMLNNSGDSLLITTNLGTVVAEASYSYCKSGYSLTLNNDNWVPSHPTPNEANKLFEESDGEDVMEVNKIEATSVQSTAASADQVKDSGQVLGTTITAQPAYPYSLAKEIITIQALVQQDKLTKNTTQKSLPAKSNETSLGGILGGLLVTISSLYARKDLFT